MRNATILVTGANGQLGQSLQLLSTQYLQKFNFIFTAKEDLNITNEAAVQLFFQKNEIKYCINTAAYTAVDKAESEKNFAYQINALGPKRLAEACLKYNVKLIHISTDYVFDGYKKMPYKEVDQTNPINYYGISKRAGEENVIEENIDAIIIRTSWVYSQFGNNFVKTMIKLMRDRESVNVVHDQLGSPTNAVSLAKCIVEIIIKLEAKQQNISGLYHYSNEGETSWYLFATEIKNILESNCIVNPIATNQYPTPAKRSLYSVLDKSKIKTEVGIVLSDWKKDLQESFETIKNNT